MKHLQPRAMRVCVSACLLGVPCRWKGDSKPCEAVQRLAKDARIEIVPFCPEVAAGLGCPRPPIELVMTPLASGSKFHDPSSQIADSNLEPGACEQTNPERCGVRVHALRVDRTGDATDALRAACEEQADALARSGGADAFVLKSRSPSCGLAAPLHDAAGRETGTAPGFWAALARERFPAARFFDETTASRL